MAELFIGGLAALSLVLVIRIASSKGLAVTPWQWGVTLGAVLYWVFVLEVIVGFLREGTPKGAVVMGTILGFVGIVWAVLLGRFVFSSRERGQHA